MKLTNGSEAAGEDPIALRKAFFLGNNVSTLRYHIRSHFTIYQERCRKDGIEIHQRAIPEDTKVTKRGHGEQTTLDGAMVRPRGPQTFTQLAILRAVAQFIVCDDQVSEELIRSLHSWYPGSRWQWQTRQYSVTVWLQCDQTRGRVSCRAHMKLPLMCTTSSLSIWTPWRTKY